MKEVPVTGATGFIGMELVRLLDAGGIRARVLVRRPHRAAMLRSFDVEPVYGDMLAPDSLRRALQGTDTVIHLGGRASFESYRQLAPTIFDGTVKLGQQAVEAGVERFVFASSLFVYGDQDRPIDHTSVPQPAIGYGRAKLQAEEELSAIAASSGMALACVRLPHVYGPQSILFQQCGADMPSSPGAWPTTAVNSMSKMPPGYSSKSPNRGGPAHLPSPIRPS